ncbi:copper resistance protein B [Brevundimonas diminuta]|jgi:copper resistance protein B|uniref:copper resistance protein B n=1 Tax=Brevundimonas TaxID=41275 RepID=UPI002002AA9E|nr:MULTISPECIES: copper resistance protein B [Brevundimonas]MCK6103961.1 copper resistance protein B [Brevundimonas sp. EYE_349]
MIRLAIGLLPLMAAAGTVSAQDHSQHPSAQNAPQTPAATVSDPHAGHDMSAMTSQAADPHAGHDMSAAQRPAQTPAQTQTPAPTQADPHAGHDMSAMAPQAADPHAGHDMSSMTPQAGNPHAGHDMSAMSQAGSQASSQADPHAGHDMSGMTSMGPPDVPTSANDAGRPPVPPPPAAALSGPRHAADAIFGEAAMSSAREVLVRENGDIRTTAVVIDRLEAGFGDGNENWAWDVGGWTGGDINRFWWKSEGGGDFGGDGEVEGEVQALYSRAVAPFWDVQAGVRQDFREGGEDTTHLVLGIQGLAPYWFEVDGAAFLSTEGDLTARFEAEYDQRITQKLILQPRVEVEASASDIPELQLASGLTHVSAGVRLRYEFKKEFAPYVGVEWSSDLGGTADLTRAMGGEPEHTRVVVGVRAWF